MSESTGIKGWGLGLGIAGAFILSAFAGYSLYSDGESSDRSGGQLKAEIRATDQGTSDQNNTATAQVGEFRFRGVDIDTTRTDPRACFAFSQPLDGSRVIEDRAYVEVEPETPVSLEVEDRRLCLLGLDQEQTYEVTIRPGYTSLDGTELTQAVTQSVVFSPKPALVGFVGDGIILPRSNNATLGVRAVNVPATRLTLYRVNHRALFQTTPNDGETTLEGNWSWNGEAWSSRVQIHEEVIDTSGRTNETVEVAYSLESIIADQGAGAYIVDLKQDGAADDNRAASSWRWLYVTDLALTAYRSDDALSVTVRSIASAQTGADVKLALIARNNEVLAETVTDASGHARFPGAALKGQDNLAPKMVMAYADGDDFAALDLSRSPLDLTAYDVAGRDPGKATDAFLYTERGVYRPGETVHLMALIRDNVGEAKFDRDGSLALIKPDGSVYAEERVSPSAFAGALRKDWALPRSAPRGRWTATLDLDGLGEVGRVRFAVEDFIPEQLRLDLRTDDAPILSDDRRQVRVAADFLYGAKGAGLDAEVEARVQVDPKPFSDFEDYSFGDAVETYRERLINLGEGVTDDDGLYSATVDPAGEEYHSASPLRLFVTAGVAEPSGRYIRDSVFLPYRSRDLYVGFNPDFEGGYAPRGQEATINLIAVNGSGASVDADGSFTLIRERYDYDWYREDGRWRYRYDRRDQVVETGDLSLTANAPTRFSRRLDYGQYRLQVTTQAGVSSYQFGVGWRRSSGGTDAPDRIGLGLSQSSVRAGDTVTLTVNSPFEGTGELVLADRTVRQVQTIRIPEGASEITLPLGRSLQSDLYAMLSVYTPGVTEQPRRAVGLVHIPMDRSEQRLSVSLEAPDLIRPRTEQAVTVQVAGLGRDAGFITLAAVDSGILQITDYSPPDPEEYYFGKRALAIDVFDDYSRMLAPFFGPDRVGGDTLGGAGLAVVPTKTVSLFHGPIAVQNGKATVTLDIPDFQGELTLIAVAWSDLAVGSASTRMIVRDPVTSELSLPRFMAPGDTAVATVSVDNVEGEAGVYLTQLLREGQGIAEDQLELQMGQRGELKFPIEADALGIREYAINTSGPGFDVTRSYPLQTRSATMPVTRSRYVRIEPGQSHALDFFDDVADLLQATVNVSVSASFNAGLDPQPLLASLNRYPYGCTEQTVSTAMPLLLSEAVGSLPDFTARQRELEIQNAVDRLIARQGADGAIGLWRPDDGNASPYVQLYATDFLLRADEEGYAVPSSVTNRLMTATRRLTRLDGGSRLNLNYQFGLNLRAPDYDLRAAERAAYAQALLARHDRPNKSDLVYLHEQFADRIEDATSLAHLGSALSAIGLSERAQDSFAKALGQVGDTDENYYNTPVRNVAAILTLASNLTVAQESRLLTILSDADPASLNTHESAWVLRAIASRSQSGTPFAENADWASDGPSARLRDVTDGRAIENPHDAPVWLRITVTGQPSGPMVAESQGVQIEKALFSMDGRALDEAQLSRGQRAIIRLDVDPLVQRSAMWVVADLLPAGFEIETVLTPADARDNAVFSWLGELSGMDMTEARDDRFVASWRSDGFGEDTRRMAYIVRAVTEGDFVFPGAHVEDMYRPTRMATTAGGRLIITGAPNL